MTREEAAAAYVRVRAATEALCAPLETEDYVVQAMEDASPAKWHLGHTAWFFEEMALAPAGVAPYDARYRFLFNSYYESVGPRVARPRRGLCTRPTVKEVYAYRRAVDEAMGAFLRAASGPAWDAAAFVVELGLNHEQQHQELLLMDVLNLFAANPLRPAYGAPAPPAPPVAAPRFVDVPGGLREVGWDGSGFSFDNERPRHRTYLEPFAVADRPVTNGDWLGFMEDGGYDDARLWLSDGWARRQAEGWEAPLYWRRDGGAWRVMTLGGEAAPDPNAAVSHVSYYEADAYARWAGARLPTEAEWETAAAALGWTLPGRVWEWTASAYLPYPGFKPFEGALGEYNGKFMSGQMVLRGGCAATPPGHIRPSYRDFFQPEKRWAFSGARLAR